MQTARQRSPGMGRPRALVSAVEAGRGPQQPAGKRLLQLPIVYEPDLPPRPTTRADCLPGGHNAVRPCPYVSCRAHLALEVTPLGALYETFPGLEIDELPATCSLDVAELGGVTLDRVGDLMNVVRERVRQIEELALRRARRAAQPKQAEEM